MNRASPSKSDSEQQQEDQTAPSKNDSEHDNGNMYFTRVLKRVNHFVLTLEQKRQSELHELLAILPTVGNDSAILIELGKHLNAAISMIKAMQQQQAANSEAIALPESRQIAPNKNNVPQRRYFSTKNKRKTSNQMAKPSADDFKEPIKTLNTIDIAVCGYCHQDDDSG